MPQPKFVVAIGACACSGGVFEGNYNVVGGVDEVIPVTAYIPGCPPRPEALIDGVVKLLNALSPPKVKKTETAKRTEKKRLSQLLNRRLLWQPPEPKVVIEEKK